MIKIVVLAKLIFAASVALLALSTPVASSFDQSSVTLVTNVQEDEPGWDCHTMGNKICGPVR